MIPDKSQLCISLSYQVEEALFASAQQKHSFSLTIVSSPGAIVKLCKEDM